MQNMVRTSEGMLIIKGRKKVEPKDAGVQFMSELKAMKMLERRNFRVCLFTGKSITKGIEMIVQGEL